MNWREIPMARLLLPLILGILLEYYLAGYVGIAISLMIVCFVSIAIIGKRKVNFAKRWHYGILLHLLLLCQGYALNELRSGQATIDLPVRQSIAIVGYVEEVKETPKKYRIFLRLKGVARQKNRALCNRSCIMLYFDKSPEAASLKTGDVLVCKVSLNVIQPPSNPHAFDYQHYLKLQGITLQAFVQNEDWEQIGYRADIQTLCNHWRNTLLNVLAQHITSKNEFAVGAALSLGYKSALSSEIRTAYVNTGAMHVLAVSGLHVGLVQLLLSWLLGLIKLKWKYWNAFKVGIIILLIWVFALLTGASPSVLRAASMFSFLAIGLELKRPVNIYNTLAISAFLLLCVNPMLLFEVGFQLSYLAVLGIVYFQPMVYRSWFIQNPIGDYIWKLVSISIAAQITTLPISLYYFHQFPVYFLLSGLVVVPAAALILSCSLLLFVFYWVPLLSTFLGYILYGILYTTNALIFLIQQLPAALLKGVWISAFSVVILYGIIICIIAAINTYKYRWVLIGGISLLLLCINTSIRKCQLFKQQALVIYHIEKHTLIDVFHSTQLITIKSQNLEEKETKFAASNHRWYRKSNREETVNYGENSSGESWMITPFFIQTPQLNIFLPSKYMPDCNELDYLIGVCVLTEKAPDDIKKWFQFGLPKQIVIDGSVSKYKASKWRDICHDYDIPVHITRSDGAFIME